MLARARVAATLGLGLALGLTASGCGPMRSSMIGLEGLAQARSARFFADERWVAITSADPLGGVMVENQPYLDGDRVVLGALVTSSGGGRTRTYCFDVAALGAAPGWQERVFWRDPDARLRAVSLERGAEAEVHAAECEARPPRTSSPG